MFGESYEAVKDLPWTITPEGEVQLPRGYSPPDPNAEYKAQAAQQKAQQAEQQRKQKAANDYRKAQSDVAVNRDKWIKDHTVESLATDGKSLTTSYRLGTDGSAANRTALENEAKRVYPDAIAPDFGMTGLDGPLAAASQQMPGATSDWGHSGWIDQGAPMGPQAKQSWRDAATSVASAQQELAAAEQSLGAIPATRSKLSGGFDPLTMLPVNATQDRDRAESAVTAARAKVEAAQQAEIDSRDLDWATEFMRSIRQNPKEGARLVNSVEFEQARRLLNAAR